MSKQKHISLPLLLGSGHFCNHEAKRSSVLAEWRGSDWSLGLAKLCRILEKEDFLRRDQ